MPVLIGAPDGPAANPRSKTVSKFDNTSTVTSNAIRELTTDELDLVSGGEKIGDCQAGVLNFGFFRVGGFVCPGSVSVAIGTTLFGNHAVAITL